MVEHWLRKFRCAFKGLHVGSIGDSSFTVHMAAAAVVILAALILQCELWQWCVLLLCIAMVMTLELMNTALESLAKGLCFENNDLVGKALDVASGAVLCGSMFAALIGSLVLGSQFFRGG